MTCRFSICCGVISTGAATLQDGSYLAADPSLTGFGLVLFEVNQDRRRYAVHLAQKFDVPKTSVGGWEDILRRADWIVMDEIKKQRAAAAS